MKTEYKEEQTVEEKREKKENFGRQLFKTSQNGIIRELKNNQEGDTTPDDESTVENIQPKADDLIEEGKLTAITNLLYLFT